MKAQQMAEANMKEQQKAQCGRAIDGAVAGSVRRSSLREEAEKQVEYHAECASKADRAASFFREHPEFDEFIQLVRSGVIGI